MSLEDLRTQIDAIDREIIERLNQRVLLASKIGKIKTELGADAYVPVREEEVFRKLELIQTEGHLDSRAIRSIYREIISASIALEKPLVIGYLGPEATFTQQAALKNFGSSVDYNPCNSIADVFHQVEKGEADAFVMDDVLLYGLAAGRPDPKALKVVGRFMTTEPLAIMLPKNDPEFKKLVDEEMRRLITSREIYPIYDKWFNKPIPPNNTVLNLPVSYLLRDFWKYPTDQVPF